MFAHSQPVPGTHVRLPLVLDDLRSHLLLRHPPHVDHSICDVSRPRKVHRKTSSERKGLFSWAKKGVATFSSRIHLLLPQVYVDPLIAKNNLISFSCEKYIKNLWWLISRQDGVFLLHIIGHNAGKLVARDVISELWHFWLHKISINDLRSIAPTEQPDRPLLTSLDVDLDTDIAKGKLKPNGKKPELPPKPRHLHRQPSAPPEDFDSETTRLKAKQP